MPGRVLGLDVGQRRIGVALSDALGMTAGRLALIERRSLEHDLEAVRRLAAEHAVTAVVVGLPLTLQGTYGPQTQRVAAFAERLRAVLSVSVEFIDERLTTVQGERALLAMDRSRKQRKAEIDQVAAQLILQQYLDREAGRPSAGPVEGND